MLLLLLEGELQFTGDPHKVHRDGGVWRAAAFGNLCTDAILGPGDVLAIGKPGDEGMLAVLYAAKNQESSGGSMHSLKLLGGSSHRCSVRSLTEVRFLAIALQELLHYIGPAPAVLSSHDGVRSMLLNVPWCQVAPSLPLAPLPCAPLLPALGALLPPLARHRLFSSFSSPSKAPSPSWRGCRAHT